MTVLMIWRHLSAYRLLRPITTACATPGRCAGGYSTGDVMPQNSMNYEGRRGGTHHNTCKAKDQFPRKGLVNGAVAHNGCQAASTTTSESTPAGTLNGTKPQCMVNGYINHGYKGKSTTAARPRTHGSTISAATDAPAAGRVHSASIPGGIPVNGTTRLDSAASLCNSKQMAPQPNLSATAKSQRRREKCRRRKRNPEVVYPENPPLSQMPPQEEEDWEGEIQEVTLTNWENICFGNRPYATAGRMFIITCISTSTPDTRRAVGPISSGCGWSPAAGGPLNGLSHHKSVGGCCVGGVEHWGLHL
ncbi:uncharacterized protein LOC115017576 isoform X3 [Cottoperca gobio]|uniref:Uncharacterized protein LOC115017576 isoform X3 n=1 Tax=Cottoperca gobio TaxID=56716 RepID=A0A6J2QYM4_COTGO|nr:uncharacterized protein LOC115017576 isoform X3 [Cottoperca gobio]